MLGAPAAVSRRAALTGGLACVLTSCASATRSSDSETITVSVGVLPVIDVVPLYLGIQRGIFRKGGLNVTLRNFQSGSEVIPATIAGQIQFGFSNVVSLLAARDRGVPLISVAGGSTSTGDPLRDINAVLVRHDSPLRSARDLVGKKVAVNSWNNIGDTTVKTAVRKDGGDDWKIHFVRIPFPEMPAQLASGVVDAVWEGEPFLSAIIQSGGRILFNNLTETYPKVQVAQYFTTEQVRQGNPRVVTAFANGIQEAMAYASTHLADVQKTLVTYTKITPASASKLVFPTWSSALDAQSTLALGQAAHEFGTLYQAPDVSGLLGSD
jgi:NitT/TauT family transport system substrate-binding protein